MADPFLGEIRMFGGNFAPRDWAFCDGQLLQINLNTALFSLLGTTYGGDGRTTFGLPDLRGRAPVHFGASSGSGASIPLGATGGSESVALTPSQLPLHGHTMEVSSDPATTGSPAGNFVAKQHRFGPAIHAEPNDLIDLHSGALEATGGAAHENMQPYQVLNFIIALMGVFPSRS